MGEARRHEIAHEVPLADNSPPQRTPCGRKSPVRNPASADESRLPARPHLRAIAKVRARRCGDYSNTKIFFSAHISFSTFGHTVTLTSPMWALCSSSINVRDWPIPPPIESGIWPFTIAR